MNTITVTLPPHETAERISNYISNSGFSTECVARYGSSVADKSVVMLVFEKYFMRNSSRASLSVLIENLGGNTVIAFAGSGGGQGTLFGFDWGAGESFENLVFRAMDGYITK